MTYVERKGKRYKHKFPNAHQTPAERRAKYDFAKALSGNARLARKCRDRRVGVMSRDVANYVNYHRGGRR